jgi:NAD(P)-dependent dehydrogenase (short-subunit alcohol dehydrogenase family)
LSRRRGRQAKGFSLTSAGYAATLFPALADEAAWVRVIETTLSGHQRLDVLVNNAGVSFAKPVADMTLAEWRRVLATNLDGVFLGTKYAINAMKPRKVGSIINMASVSGINAFPGASAYGASKAATRHFSRVATIECADAQTGIRVNVVSPSGVKTPMWEGMDFFPGVTRQAWWHRRGVCGDGGHRRFAAVLLAGGDCPYHPVPGVGRVVAPVRY